MKRITLFILLLFSSYVIGYSQVSLSKIAIDAGWSASYPGAGLKLGTTYFVSDNVEIYTNLNVVNLRSTGLSVSNQYSLKFGSRFLFAQTERISILTGLEVGYYLTNVDRATFGNALFRTSDTDQGLNIVIPLLIRYSISSRFSLEAELGIGLYNSLIDNGYFILPTSGLGLKYRLGNGAE